MLKKMIGIVAVGACSLLSGCNTDPYIINKNKKNITDLPAKKIEQVVKEARPSIRIINYKRKNWHAKRDSLIFHTALNNTNTVKSSTNVTEFNKIASINQYNNINEEVETTKIRLKKHYYAPKDGTLVCPLRIRNFKPPFIKQTQVNTDSILNNKLFKKFSLLDRNKLSFLDNIHKKIKL